MLVKRERARRDRQSIDMIRLIWRLRRTAIEYKIARSYKKKFGS